MGEDEEWKTERAAMMALVEALPKCHRGNGCGFDVATVIYRCKGCPADGFMFCDSADCVPKIPSAGLRRYMVDLPYAAPLRAMLALMATWPEEK